MGHEAVASYLRPSYPRDYATESMAGNEYAYRGPSATLAANVPSIGAAWADGAPVLARQIFEINGNSGMSEMVVTTGSNPGYAGPIGTPAVQESEYELDYRPVTLPLEGHPAFQAGGDYELGAVGRKHVLGWRAELDPALKAARKYRQLDSEGNPGGEIDIETESPEALAFIKLCEIGVEEWVFYMPIWRKRGHYIGSSAPSTAEIGNKGMPAGSGYPGGYEWVKSKDRAARVGRSTKWIREEEWEGALKVYVDKDEIFLPGDEEL